MLEKLTRFTEKFAYHKHAPWWLFFYAVIESVIFPIPPDVLLIALTLGRPRRGHGFALIAATGSVVGGVFGYMLGRFAFDPIVLPILEWLCAHGKETFCPGSFVPQLQTAFDKHGLWLIGISGFSPIIPYRFTILIAGMAEMKIIPFIIVSFIVHLARYGLVCWLVANYGQRAVFLINKYFSRVLIIIGIVALAVYLAARYF